MTDIKRQILAAYGQYKKKVALHVKIGIPEDAWHRCSDEEVRHVENGRMLGSGTLLSLDDVMLLQARFETNKEHVKIRSFDIDYEQ